MVIDHPPFAYQSEWTTGWGLHWHVIVSCMHSTLGRLHRLGLHAYTCHLCISPSRVHYRLEYLLVASAKLRQSMILQGLRIDDKSINLKRRSPPERVTVAASRICTGEVPLGFASLLQLIVGSVSFTGLHAASNAVYRSRILGLHICQNRQLCHSALARDLRPFRRRFWGRSGRDSRGISDCRSTRRDTWYSISDSWSALRVKTSHDSCTLRDAVKGGCQFDIFGGQGKLQ